MAENPSAFPGAETWTKFWTEAMSRMPGMAPAPTGSPPPASPSELLTKMQQTFLEAWARALDEYMRSEAFLQMMKKSMEGALAFRQQMDELFRRTLHAGQSPSRADTSDIMQFLHSFEDRVLDQLTDLTRRVDRLEAAAPAARPGSGEPRR